MAQLKTIFIPRTVLYARNIEKYGDEYGPSINWKTQQNPELLAYKALKTDGSDLGLISNNLNIHIDNWLAKYKEINASYPDNEILSNLTMYNYTNITEEY